MKDIILSKMEQGTTLSDLVNATGKSEKQIGNILRILESDGYLIKREFNDQGCIFYSFLNNFSNEPLKLIPTSNEVRAILISDLHIGVENSGIERMPKIIEYMKQNNIHVMIILGDIFEGVIGRKQTQCMSVEDQVQHFFKHFPFEQGIISLVLYGNHDFSIYQEKHFDVSKRLSIRPDIINLGYGIGKIYIGNELVGFQHDLVFCKSQETLENLRLIFKGHSHRFDIHDNIVITPAMLNEPFYDELLSCGFLDVTFNLNQAQLLDSLKIKHFVFLQDMNYANEIYLPFETSKTKKKI